MLNPPRKSFVIPPSPLQIPWTPASCHLLIKVFAHVFLLCFFFCFPKNSTDIFLQITHLLVSIVMVNHHFPSQSPWLFQCLGAKVKLSSLAWWYHFSTLSLSLRAYMLGFKSWFCLLACITLNKLLNLCEPLFVHFFNMWVKVSSSIFIYWLNCN